MKKLLLTIFVLFSLEGIQTFAQCAAGFGFNNSVVPPLVIFTNTSTGQGGLTYIWNFGDGVTDFQQNPYHTYPDSGTYLVCLSISDGLGCTDTVCQSVVVGTIPPSIAVYLGIDSNNLYNCSAPAAVEYSFRSVIQGSLPTDSVTFNINFGDGFDSTFSLAIDTGTLVDIMIHEYQNPGSYLAQIIVTGPNNLSATDVLFMPIIVASSCGTISGTVYNDINGNCIYDSGEELPNIYVQLFNGSQFVSQTSSDINGDYSFNIPSGLTYDVRINSYGGNLGHYVPSCPPTGTITVNTIPSTGNNFGVVCPPGYDLQGNLTGWHFIPGLNGSICVCAYNQRCNSPSGHIDIILPSTLTPHPDSSGSGYTISGQTVSYPIDNTRLEWFFCIPVTVSQNANIGDSVCIDMNIQPIAGDSVPFNNSGTFCFAISNSHDPNDKYVNPAGEGPQGLIRPETPLTYTIRFQNTGNAVANNIFILDTLNTNLDPASVELIGSSHNVEMTLLAGNILRFSFDNIQLSDSNSNEAASHGFVTYRIKQMNSLPQLSTITNTAAIYFDFNPAIITNTTLNTVDQFLAIQSIHNENSLVNVFPNPANGKCYLNFDNIHPKIISVTDMLGKEVFRNPTTADSYLLNTEKFAEGIYTVRISENGNAVDTFKLVVSHKY